jgi:ATP-dependent Lon protease
MASGYDKEQQRPDQQQPQTLVTPLQHARLASFGCLAKLVRVQRSGVGIFGVYMEGIQRCELVAPVTTTTTTSSPSPLVFQVRYQQETIGSSIPTGLMDAYMKLSKEFVQQMRQLQMPDSLILQLTKMTNTLAPLALADLMISIIETSFNEKWNMLATTEPTKRITLASTLMQRQLQVLHISQHVHSTIEGKLTKQQREFYLRQQVC